jgi:hypothetical protein
MFVQTIQAPSNCQEEMQIFKTEMQTINNSFSLNDLSI